MRVEALNELRKKEISEILKKHELIFRNAKVLEVGGGTGIQAREIKKLASHISSIDLESSNYVEHAEGVMVYDGFNIPFPDKVFDVIYSSNVLEHIKQRDQFQAEIKRVLKSDGVCVHILPTHYWKFWTTIVKAVFSPVRILKRSFRVVLGSRKSITDKSDADGWLELFLGEPHGEFGSTLSEFNDFNPATWREYFGSIGWVVVEDYKNELFYEGHYLFGQSLGWSVRMHLSRILGYATHTFVLAMNCRK